MIYILNINKTRVIFVQVVLESQAAMQGRGVILKRARDSPGTGNNARRIGILFKSNFCRNYNM
jgi:hypothetical protein